MLSYGDETFKEMNWQPSEAHLWKSTVYQPVPIHFRLFWNTKMYKYLHKMRHYHWFVRTKG